MDQGNITKQLIDRIENLHCDYGVSLTRHREWATEEYVRRLADTFEGLSGSTREAILSLRDRKGNLIVIWSQPPSDEMRREVDRAWEFVGNELSDSNIHMYAKEI